MPDPPTNTKEPKEQRSVPESEPGKNMQKPRKKSRTPALPDDVEVVGDIETVDAGSSGE